MLHSGWLWLIKLYLL